MGKSILIFLLKIRYVITKNYIAIITMKNKALFKAKLAK